MLTILCYHGVTIQKSYGIENYSRKHIPHAIFKKQLNIIKNSCQVISMDDIIDIYKNKINIKDNLTAITFDDGFKNNIEIALPILEEFNFGATLYITSGLIGTNKLFWVDQLENSINHYKKENLKIDLNGEIFDFKTKTKQNKIQALNKIKKYCKEANNNEKNRVVDYVNQLCEGDRTNRTKVSNYEVMNWDDIKKINQHKNFIIGGHSLRHDLFSKIETESQLKHDIETSIEVIQNKIANKITHYSYPEGQSIHFNNKVIKILKENGIKCCPTAIDGINDGTEDLFSLKRIMPGFMGRDFPNFKN